MDDFPQAMRPTMDASVSELKESIVEIASEALYDVENFQRELGKTPLIVLGTAFLRRVGPPTRVPM